jgi:hypothetical protein
MFKVTRAKWAAGVAQAGAHLLCKSEALSSNLSQNKTTTTTKASLDQDHMGK